jgi:hypothetical protein
MKNDILLDNNILDISHSNTTGLKLKYTLFSRTIFLDLFAQKPQPIPLWKALFITK